MDNNMDNNIIIYNSIDNMKTYTIDEVKLHNTTGDAWMVIDGYVYDVSLFCHPGGNIIKKGYGIDASQYFHNPNIRHSSHAVKLLKKYLIGKQSGK